MATKKTSAVSADSAPVEPKPEVVESPAEEVQPEPKRKYVLYERYVDKFTTIANRVELTPAVCDECGLDLLALNNSEFYYDELEDEEQRKVRAAVDQHKKLVHTRDKLRIIDEDEIPNKWLGKNYRGRAGRSKIRRGRGTR